MKDKISYAILLVAIFALIGGIKSSAAGNTTDSTFSFAVSASAPSSYKSTAYRLKYNDTSVYIYPGSCSTGMTSFKAQVYGAKKNDGEGAKNCGKNYSYRTLKPNYYYYYATTIDGDTYTHAKLRIASTSYSGTVAGKWSPDNSKGYTTDITKK